MMEHSKLRYIAAMRDEAARRRTEAKGKSGSEAEHLAERAIYFDACADEAQAELDTR